MLFELAEGVPISLVDDVWQCRLLRSNLVNVLVCVWLRGPLRTLTTLVRVTTRLWGGILVNLLWVVLSRMVSVVLNLLMSLWRGLDLTIVCSDGVRLKRLET